MVTIWADQSLTVWDPVWKVWNNLDEFYAISNGPGLIKVFFFIFIFLILTIMFWGQLKSGIDIVKRCEMWINWRPALQVYIQPKFHWHGDLKLLKHPKLYIHIGTPGDSWKLRKGSHEVLDYPKNSESTMILSWRKKESE